MFDAISHSMKSIGYWLTISCLACLPGCSGCQARTSPTETPVPTQSESSPATQDDPSEKNASDSGGGSATENQTGQAESASGNPTANSDGKSNSSSGSQKTSRSSTGNVTAQKGSVANSGEVSGESSTTGEMKPSRLAGKLNSPGEATAAAIALKQSSDKAAAGEEYGQAFELAAKAWEAVQTFPEDVACQKISGDLERRMDELGTLANAQNRSKLTRDKPLIVR